MTDEQYQQLIILEVGDDSQGTLISNMALLWLATAGEASAERRALVAKRRAIHLMMARARDQVDFKGPDGSGVNLSDRMDHLKTMLAQVNSELGAIDSAPRAFSYAGRRSDGYTAAAAEDV